MPLVEYCVVGAFVGTIGSVFINEHFVWHFGMQNIIIMLHCELCCCAIHYTLVTPNTTSLWQHFSSNEQFVSRSFKDIFEKYPNTERLQEVCL